MAFVQGCGFRRVFCCCCCCCCYHAWEHENSLFMAFTGSMCQDFLFHFGSNNFHTFTIQMNRESPTSSIYRSGHVSLLPELCSPEPSRALHFVASSLKNFKNSCNVWGSLGLAVPSGQGTPSQELDLGSNRWKHQNVLSYYSDTGTSREVVPSGHAARSSQTAGAWVPVSRLQGFH